MVVEFGQHVTYTDTKGWGCCVQNTAWRKERKNGKQKKRDRNGKCKPILHTTNCCLESVHGKSGLPVKDSIFYLEGILCRKLEPLNRVGVFPSIWVGENDFRGCERRAKYHLHFLPWRRQHTLLKRPFVVFLGVTLIKRGWRFWGFALVLYGSSVQIPVQKANNKDVSTLLAL